MSTRRPAIRKLRAKLPTLFRDIRFLNETLPPAESEEPDNLLDEVLEHADYDESEMDLGDLDQEMFASIDTDQDGKISPEEFRMHEFAYRGYGTTDWLAKFQDLDSNSDGFVTSEEFTVEKMEKSHPKKEIKFEAIDKNADGCVDKQEFFAANYKALAGNMSKESLPLSAVYNIELLTDRLLACMDIDNSTCVNATEYEVPAGSATQNCTLAAGALYQVDIEFAALDANSNGEISLPEYYRYVDEAYFEIDAEQAQAIFDMADTNQDKVVSRKEYEDVGGTR